MTALRGQVAVVTGASSGIGRAIALGLGREGAQLALVGRQPGTLQAVGDALGGQAAGVRCYQADLALAQDVQALAAALLRELGHVDVLVHGAGFIRLGPVESGAADELDIHYRTNLRAPYLLTQQLLPSLEARQGQIVFVNSTAALNAKAQAGAYAASKHGLKALADSVREEVNAAGVRVLTLLLGRTATPMQAAVSAMEGRAYQPELLMQPQDVADVVLHALALPRTVEVTEITMRPLRKSY